MAFASQKNSQHYPNHYVSGSNFRPLANQIPLEPPLNSTQVPTTLLDLPDLVLERMAEFLEPADIPSCMLCCTKLHALLQRRFNILLRTKCLCRKWALRASARALFGAVVAGWEAGEIQYRPKPNMLPGAFHDYRPPNRRDLFDAVGGPYQPDGWSPPTPEVLCDYFGVVLGSHVVQPFGNDEIGAVYIYVRGYAPNPA